MITQPESCGIVRLAQGCLLIVTRYLKTDVGSSTLVLVLKYRPLQYLYLSPFLFISLYFVLGFEKSNSST